MRIEDHTKLKDQEFIRKGFEYNKGRKLEPKCTEDVTTMRWYRVNFMQLQHTIIWNPKAKSIKHAAVTITPMQPHGVKPDKRATFLCD